MKSDFGLNDTASSFRFGPPPLQINITIKPIAKSLQCLLAAALTVTSPSGQSEKPNIYRIAKEGAFSSTGTVSKAALPVELHFCLSAKHRYRSLTKNVAWRGTGFW